MKQTQWFFGLMLAAWLAIPCPTTPAIRYKVIERPKATVTEKNDIPLERIKVIGDALGGEEYLFVPSGAVVDGQNRLLVSDNMQSSIFMFDPRSKLIRRFGRFGEGPGEFISSGRYALLSLSIGLDGNTWVNEVNKQRVSVFNPDGQFLRVYRLNHSSFLEPRADSAGVPVLQQFRENKLVFYKHKGETIFELPHAEEKIELLFRAPVMDDRTRELNKVAPFQYDPDDLQYLLPDDRTLVILFMCSGEFCLVRDKKLVKRAYIWPEDLIADRMAHPGRLSRGYIPLFHFLADSCSRRDRFWVEAFTGGKPATCPVYEFNINGEINAVYLPKTHQTPANSLKLMAVGGDGPTFFFRAGDFIEVYRPKNRNAAANAKK